MNHPKLRASNCYCRRMNPYERHRFPPDIISYAVPKALRGPGSLALLSFHS